MTDTLAFSQQKILLDEQVTAHNYHPLPVVIASAKGAWVTDVEGRRYLDALAGYSALNFGHGHPTLVAVAKEQLERVTLTSRAFHAQCHLLSGGILSRSRAFFHTLRQLHDRNGQA